MGAKEKQKSGKEEYLLKKKIIMFDYNELKSCNKVRNKSNEIIVK